jgi:hypothetical protein
VIFLKNEPLISKERYSNKRSSNIKITLIKTSFQKYFKSIQKPDLHQRQTVEFRLYSKFDQSRAALNATLSFPNFQLAVSMSSEFCFAKCNSDARPSPSGCYPGCQICIPLLFEEPDSTSGNSCLRQEVAMSDHQLM